MISTLFLVFCFLGLIIGSFLNVVIYRLNTSKSLGGRSMCLSCQRKLHWYDMVPVFSFFILQGRCRSCKVKISTQYPLVELASGLIFGLLFCKFRALFFLEPGFFILTYVYYAVVFSLLLVITVYDIKHKIIPDNLVFIFGLLSFVGMFLLSPMHLPTIYSLLAGLVISLPFALFWFFSKGAWMGLGDAKLAIGLGFLLGMSGVLTATVLAFWSGAIVGLLLIALRKVKGLQSEMPFAPFLVLGTFIAFFFEVNLFNVF